MNNKINLVTGGTGFLGSHLTKYLLDAGEQVISLDNNFTGSKKNIKEIDENILVIDSYYNLKSGFNIS